MNDITNTSKPEKKKITVPKGKTAFECGGKANLLILLNRFLLLTISYEN